MTTASPIAPRSINDVGTWDLETDVLVVGFGCAGASAAVDARRAGADVVVVERAGGHGGTSAMAGGEIYLGGGTAIQKACGFDDTSEAMYAYLSAAVGPGADDAKVSLYCERSVEHFEWLVGCGVPFKPSFFADPCWEPPTDDGLVYSGGENTWPFNEIAPPAPRGHVPTMSGKRPGERSAGWMLMDHLAATARDLGVESEVDTRVERLVVDRDGQVVGVIARRYGDERALRARRGVVLASGGFGANRDMVDQYAPLLRHQYLLGTDGDDGTSIRMGQGVGAGVKHMEAGQTSFPSVPALMYPSIIVNEQGVRFINEDTYAGRVGQAALFRQGGRTFLVTDAEKFEAVPAADRWGAQPTWVCETVAELEAEMGLPERALQATVEVYNHHAERGTDPVFHKRAEWAQPLRSPFGAVDLRKMPFGIFTLGGLHTNVDGEVIGPEAEPIAGLYAAGRASSGIPAWGYSSGTSLGDGTFFGRRAGCAAAARTPQ